MQVPDEFSQSRRTVERAVAGVQDVSRRVVDIEEDGVEAAPRCLRIKTGGAVSHGEEVAPLKADPSIRHQFGGVWKQRTLMPADDLSKCLHHDERMNAG